jgi:hypothetical protein
MTLANASPFTDPFIRCVYATSKGIIRDHLLWQVAANPGQQRAHRFQLWVDPHLALSCGNKTGRAIVFLTTAALRLWRLNSHDTCQTFAYTIVEPVHDHVHRNVDGMSKPLRVGSAMRLYDHPIQPKHNSAVIATGVKEFPQPLQTGTGQ